MSTSKVGKLSRKLGLIGYIAITGSIFCEGNTVLKGVVRGSVFTQKFLVNAEGSRYINHIFGGEIRSNKLPKSFGGLPLKRASKEIAQWMY